MHYEHRDRDLDLASHWARQLETGVSSHRRHEETARRLARLGRKLAGRNRRQCEGLPLDT